MISRKRLYSLHSWLGLQLGLLLFIVCFSGTIAVFTPEIDAWLDPVRQAKKPGGESEKATWSDIHDAAQEAHPYATIRYLYRSENPHAADMAFLQLSRSDFRRVFINPYSLEVSAERPVVDLKQAVRIFHKQLYLIPGTVGFHGLFIVGVFGIVLLFSALTGILAFKNWTRSLVTLRLNKRPRVFYSDLHRSIGAWTLLASILFAVTGLWYLVEKLSESTGFLAHDPAPPSISAETLSGYGDTLRRLPLSELMQGAHEAYPELEPQIVYLPATPQSPLRIVGHAEANLARPRANTLVIDPYNGDVISKQRGIDLDFLDRLVHSVDPLHFGTFGGLFTRWLWFLFGLALSLGILAGIVIYTLRIRRTQNSNTRSRPYLWSVTGLATSLILVASALSFIAYSQSSLTQSEPPPSLHPIAKTSYDDIEGTLFRIGEPTSGFQTIALAFEDGALPNGKQFVFSYEEQTVEGRSLAGRIYANLALEDGESFDVEKLHAEFLSSSEKALPELKSFAPISDSTIAFAANPTMPTATLASICGFGLLILLPSLAWLLKVRR